jgi:transposase
VAYTIMIHLDSILRWFYSHITNGILEWFNSLLQSTRSKARGYYQHGLPRAR